MGLEHVAPSIEAMNREIVLKQTFGHLAPKKNTTYRGHVVWSLGVFGSEYLNPTVLECELGELQSSPWFFDALMDFLGKIHDNKPNGEFWSVHERRDATEGRIFRWDGTFRNYTFCGKVRELFAEGLKDEERTTIRKTSKKLTKKDYVRIANEIRQIKTCVARQKKVKELLPSLRASNPNFDEKRFFVACNA